MVKIVTAKTDFQFQQVHKLMNELMEWDNSETKRLGFDADKFLDFYYCAESAELPGRFAPPEGCLLLATCSAEAAGCIAFQKLTSDICEMKRMYVRPEFRGKQIGRQLGETLIAKAEEVGYKTMRLETTAFMQGAVALYSSLGFKTCEPYYAIPPSFREITIFMELDLGRKI